jgi:hypothetical protein
LSPNNNKRALEKTLEETSGASLIAHAPTEQIKQGFEYRGKREREKKQLVSPKRVRSSYYSTL